jgi:hypothetical protein
MLTLRLEQIQALKTGVSKANAALQGYSKAKTAYEYPNTHA